MIEQKKRKQNYYMRESIKKEVGKDASVDDVLLYLIGDSDGCGGSDYVVYKYEYPQRRSLMNRINYCWVFPLFLLSMPVVWLATGEVGIKRTSKIGSIVDWLVKFDN